MGVPFGPGYPLYLFCLFKTKKDAAAIPNAAFGELFKNSISYANCLHRGKNLCHL
jgi:hypothetical protein